MNEKSKSLFSWLVENCEKGTADEFVNLSEIKAKFKDPLTSVAVGNSVTNIFPDVKVKQYRCKENWSKKHKGTMAYDGKQQLKSLKTHASFQM